MKKILTSIILGLFIYTNGQTFSFTSNIGLDSQLHQAVTKIEQIIERKGEGVRTPILILLGDLKKDISDNERSLYIVEFVMKEIASTSRSLTQDDFPKDYKNIDIVVKPPQIIATVVNNGALGQRNDDAFEYLAGFIFGDNTQATKIAMTSPVTRAQIDPLRYETAFIMPTGRTLDNLPTPNSDRITIKEQSSSLKAVWRFSGYVTQERVDIQWKMFQEELGNENITWYGMPMLAQYDGPWVPENTRTNELRVSLNP